MAEQIVSSPDSNRTCEQSSNSCHSHLPRFSIANNAVLSGGKPHGSASPSFVGLYENCLFRFIARVLVLTDGIVLQHGDLLACKNEHGKAGQCTTPGFHGQ